MKKVLKLTEDEANLFRKQVLIILADYRDMRDPSPGGGKNPLQHESTRVEISERILENLYAVGKSR